MVQQTTSPYTGRPITEWYDYEIELHDADGDEIGNVVEVNLTSSLLRPAPASSAWVSRVRTSCLVTK